MKGNYNIMDSTISSKVVEARVLGSIEDAPDAHKKGPGFHLVSNQSSTTASLIKYLDLLKTLEDIELDCPFLEINFVGEKRLKNPISIIIESDENAFIARSPDFPIYGYGESQLEAIESYKRELYSMYQDLKEDDNFSPDWLAIKKFLDKNLVP